MPEDRIEHEGGVQQDTPPSVALATCAGACLAHAASRLLERRHAAALIGHRCPPRRRPMAERGGLGEGAALVYTRGSIRTKRP